MITSPAFPLAGRVSFPARATGAATLVEGRYGTGFDTCLLTKDHVSIAGVYIYMPGGVPPARRLSPLGCTG